MDDNFIGYADNGDIIVGCWQCGGEGKWASCEEEWACLNPEEGCELCMTCCDICNGEGSYNIPSEKAGE